MNTEHSGSAKNTEAQAYLEMALALELAIVKELKLDAQSSIADVTAELKARGICLQGSVGGADYPLDRHFQLYCFYALNTPDDIVRFVEHLESECPECAKARQIRKWFEDCFWTESIERMKVVLSVARRTCCGNHETGSYAKTGSWWNLGTHLNGIEKISGSSPDGSTIFK